MDIVAWFSTHLQASADGFLWGIDQLPPALRAASPPIRPDDWPASRHLFHLVYYEQLIALPSMRQWLGGPKVADEELDEQGAWAEGAAHDLTTLREAFQAVRAQQIALLPLFDSTAWDEPREALWGTVTLRWVVTKTYQHTCEHTHDVLRMALWWGGRPTRLGR